MNNQSSPMSTIGLHSPPRTTCRACYSGDLIEVYDFGSQYVSDFVAKEDIHNGIRCPIIIDQCRNCTLVQARYSVPMDLLYRSNYWYRSGTNEMMREALKDVVKSVTSRIDLRPRDIVLDIGSNDGTLLRNYTKDMITIGVEPAKNLLEEGRRGINLLLNNYWSHEVYKLATDVLSIIPLSKKPRIITAIGMLYDLEDPNLFIRDVALTLADDGIFVVQLMGLLQTYLSNDVGNFCHEHLEFYTLRSFSQLLEKYGLTIFDLEMNSVNGGSYRFYIGHSSLDRPKSDAVQKFFSKEAELLNGPGLTSFFNRIKYQRDMTVGFFKTLTSGIVKGSKTIMVYGASTKGNFLLQWYNLGNIFSGAVDRDANKWGRYTIGTGIPIVSEEDGRRMDPEYYFVLPYAFIDSFIQREAVWRRRGGRFIVPLPIFRVV